MRSISELQKLTPEELIAAVDKGEISDVKTIEIALDTALTSKQYDVAGTFFAVVQGSAASSKISVEFNRYGSGSIDFTQGLYFTRPFARFFVTCTAQAGETVKIVVASSSEIFKVQDNRSATLLTSLLTDIVTNTTALVSTAAAGVLKTLGDIGTGNPIMKLLRSLDGDTGTQIHKYSTTITNTTETMHTVTAGKTFYLSSAYILQNTTVATNGFLSVTDAADNVLFEIARCTAATPLVISRQFPMPLKIAAGCKIKATAGDANSHVNATIDGWEE